MPGKFGVVQPPKYFNVVSSFTALMPALSARPGRFNQAFQQGLEDIAKSAHLICETGLLDEFGEAATTMCQLRGAATATHHGRKE
jgi:hypothetical protein